MQDWTNKLGGVDWSALLVAMGLKVLGALVIFAVGLRVVKWLSRVTAGSLARANVDATAVQFLHKATYVVLMGLLVLTALTFVGVPMTSAFAILGAAGLAIGLALKDSLSNIASGVMLVTLKPFRVGNLVTINNETGTVESISIFQTQLRGADNQTIVLPNSLITNESIINLTPDVMRRVQLIVGIGHDDDIDTARKVAMDIMRADDRILSDPEPSVLVYELTENNIQLGIRCHTNNEDNFATKCDLNERIKKGFDAAGVRIARPQRSVHLVQRDGDVDDGRRFAEGGESRPPALPQGSAET